jgi:hypothetical protein
MSDGKTINEPGLKDGEKARRDTSFMGIELL